VKKIKEEKCISQNKENPFFKDLYPSSLLLSTKRIKSPQKRKPLVVSKSAHLN